MELPDYYYQLNVRILNGQDQPVGGGLCIDESHVITCAHVVETALNNNGSNKISVYFSSNESIGDDFFSGETILNGWEDPVIKALTTADPRYYPLRIKNDLAVLKINLPDNLRKIIKQQTRELRFLEGNLYGENFRVLTINSHFVGTAEDIEGKFGTVDFSTGTTILKPSNGAQSFVERGASGSPVFAECEIENEKISGIAGYVDFVTWEANSKSALLLNCKTIKKLLLNANISCSINSRDVSEWRDVFLRRKMRASVIEAAGANKYYVLCDRQPQLEAARARFQVMDNAKKIFFMYGNNRQRMDAFVDRYRYEMIATKPRRSNVLNFQIPSVTNKDQFYFNLVRNIFRAYNKYDSLPRGLDINNCTIENIVNQLCLSADTDYILLGWMENDDFSTELLPLFQWFNKTFLSPLEQKGSLDNIHVFISFEFNPSENCLSNINALNQAFPNAGLPEFINVDRKALTEWLEFMLGNSRDVEPFITKFYPPDLTDFDMLDTINYFKQALAKNDAFQNANLSSWNL